MRKIHKIPTLIAILVVIIASALGIFFIDKTREIRSRASVAETPQDVRVSNIAEDSFAISWITAKETVGFVAFGQDENLDKTTGEPSASFVHYLRIENLKPSSDYFFRINSNGKVFGDGGLPYKVKTGPVLPLPGKTAVAFGRVLSNSVPYPDALVYVSFVSASLSSSLTDSSGRFLVSLSSIRNSTLSSYTSYNKDAILNIEVVAPSGKASAKVRADDSLPIPDISLGETYDFTTSSTVRGKGQVPEASLNVPGQGSTSLSPSLSPTPTPTLSPTPTPTKTSVQLPVGGTNPTSGLSPTPTSAIKPTATPTPSQKLLSAGGLTPTALTFIMGLALIITGFFFTKNIKI